MGLLAYEDTGGSPSTAIPCGSSLAATFDRDLVERVGQLLGEETKAKNSSVLLGPTMNMSCSPLGGRKFENFGEDPYLTGVMARHIIRGVHARGVGSCPKHFFAGIKRLVDSIWINKWTSELCAKSICDPSKWYNQDPWTFMTSYSIVNHEHMNMNKYLVTDILRDEWGFRDFVMSDWGGSNSTIRSVLAGLSGFGSVMDTGCSTKSLW